MSGDRIIVLGITRASIEELKEMKRVSKYGENVDFVWVDAEYKDYLKRVYSIEATRAIIVLRPKFDLFWTDRGSRDMSVWLDDIVKGNLSGKSSVCIVMRGWKGIVWIGESIYVCFYFNV